LIHPANAPTSSEFGWRMHPVLGRERLHAGLDYAASCGTPVYAAMEGSIIIATFSSGGGNKIVVDHGVQRGINLTTSYLHLEAFAQTSGRVEQGDLIGYVGNTGLSAGCHLHFETRENGTPVNPRNWL
jgi:murein DD-endopeptidase MepM/ murein hydrolase activator NlpD